MPRIFVKSINADQQKYYRNVIKYVAKAGHCIQRYIGATNILLPSDGRGFEKKVAGQIENIRDYYGQNDTRLGIHVNIIFSVTEVAYLNHRTVLELGYFLATTEFENCITYFAVHDNTQLLHIDMLLIPVNIMTGKMYGCQRGGWNAIMQRFCQEIKKYVPEDMIEKFQVSFTD